MSSHLSVLWTAEPASTLHGLALSRESGRVLVWNNRLGLYLYDSRGQCEAEWRAPAELTAAAMSADGKHFAVIDTAGQLRLLRQDLTPRWNRPLPQATTVAVDSFGSRLAVADAAGDLYLLDQEGETIWRTNGPRSLRFLTFVPESAVLVGSADFGLVLCCDSHGRCLWRDAPVTHTGSLATSGDGGTVAIARYSEGLCCYAVDQPRPRTVRGTQPCRLADIAYDGRTLATAGLDDRICLRDADGTTRAEMTLSSRPVALALSPLADRVVLALASGSIQMLTTSDY
jgi:hypothetical protein